MYSETYVKKLEEKIELLEKENKTLHETVEYLTRKLFGRSTEKTSALLGQFSFFDEAENEADPNVPEPTLEEVEKYRRKKFKGQREELLKKLPHDKVICKLDDEDLVCPQCYEALEPEERKQKRLEQEKPVLDAFWSWVDKNANSCLPKSKIYTAFNYAINQKEGLMNYLQDGNCSISNNLAENSIRPFTVGRRNWLFSASPKGAGASAAVYSIIETAKANGLNPYEYLKYIFKNLPGVQFGQHPEFLEDLLPWDPEVQFLCKKSDN